MVKTTLLIVFFLLILVVAKQSAAQPSELDLGECSRHLKAYLDAVITGDLESARTYWRPPDLEAASRLGLSYHGPWLKVDSDSPIWSFVEHLRRDDVHYTAMPPQEFAGGPLDGVVNIRLTFDQQGQRTTFRYYFDRIDETWLLASPVRLVCEQGPSVPTHWVTVYDRRFAMSATLPPRLIALLDSCVAVVADQLAFTPEQLALLERERLGYLLAGPEWVEQLAGAPTVGVANLQQDVVVTSHPCHAHELAHLLVNFWLGELPLYTLPLLQEGIATHLGGRWGRHPRVLHRVGHTTLTDGLLTLDELLTYNQFHGQSADLTYPPAGVFAGFVLERYGPDGLRRAYQSVSGTWEEVSSWNAAVVKARLSAALGVSWTTLADEFSTFVAEPPAAAIVSGMLPDPDSAMTSCARGDRLDITATDSGDRKHVVIRVRAETGLASGALLFGAGSDTGQVNALFADHFPDREYHGQTHSLIFSPQEAKLYDYRLQMLVALHAQGFWPAVDYASSDGRTLSFGVRKDLLPTEPVTLVEFAE